MNRSRERLRRAALAALGSAAAKLVFLSSTLISVPLTLSYLGSERYGLWMTLTSLIAMLSFSDFGLGNGLVNAVAHAHGRSDPAAIRDYACTALFTLCGISAVVFCIGATLFYWIPLPDLFRVTGPQASHEFTPALMVGLACFCIGVPLSVVPRLQLALQDGLSANLWQAVGHILGLLSLLIVVTSEGGLPLLVLAVAGAPLLALVVNGAVLFRKYPSLSLRLRHISKNKAVELFRVGGLFLVLQLTVAVGYTSDTIVIAKILGPEQVTQYAVPEKLFGIITVLISMVMVPLWPAYGEAIASGDTGWVVSTLKRSLVYSTLFGIVLSVPLVLWGDTILRWWVGGEFRSTFWLLVGFAVWKVIASAGAALAAFLNALNVAIRFQVAIAICTAVAALVGKVVLVTSFGASGAVWSSVFAYAVFSLVPIAVFLPRYLNFIAARACASP